MAKKLKNNKYVVIDITRVARAQLRLLALLAGKDMRDYISDLVLSQPVPKK